MGREIRRVPANWQHPEKEIWSNLKQMVEKRYVPLHDDRETALVYFQESIEKMGLAEAIDYHGGGPRSDHYVDFKKDEATWYQVYETVSEGTPVTPPFETREQLVEYLVANGDFWDQERRKEGSSMACAPWSRRAAEKFVFGDGWAPSFIVQDGHIKSGSEILED